MWPKPGRFIRKLHARCNKQVMMKTVPRRGIALTRTSAGAGSAISFILLTPLQAMTKHPVRVVNYYLQNVAVEGLPLFDPP
jgi:hypothetical protein